MRDISPLPYIFLLLFTGIPRHYSSSTIKSQEQNPKSLKVQGSQNKGSRGNDGSNNSSRNLNNSGFTNKTDARWVSQEREFRNRNCDIVMAVEFLFYFLIKAWLLIPLPLVNWLNQCFSNGFAKQPRNYHFQLKMFNSFGFKRGLALHRTWKIQGNFGRWVKHQLCIWIPLLVPEWFSKAAPHRVLYNYELK